MSDKHLHIISFDIPYPPNYGGVIDVFYKIKFLHREGIKIHLHCFEYGRGHSQELKRYCDCVFYYKRRTSFRSHFSLTPYIINSRVSEALISRLLQDRHPVLMEGLHSCYYLTDKRLKGRKLIFRESNIEHRYYRELMKQEKNIAEKIFFLSEAFKLERFEKNIQHANLTLTVSEEDKNYFSKKYPGLKVVNIPSFHANEEVNAKPGKGDYLLYHGNLSIQENRAAVEFLLSEIAPKIELPVIVAGLNPDSGLKKLIAKKKNVTLIENPDEALIFDLIRNAHINFLYTKQATGLKLKLLNALYNGRFCLVNQKMLHGIEADELCVIENDPKRMIEQIKKLAEEPFTGELIEKRKKLLLEKFSPVKNTAQLIKIIYGQA